MQSSSSGARAVRRVVTLVLSALALVALVFIGRRATSAASAMPSPDAAASIADGAPDGDVEAATSSSAASDAAPPALEIQPDGAVLVDLNHATEDELRKLPGVGPSKARAIVELRARIGGLKRLEDLARIKGFGKSTLRKLRPLTRITPR